MRRKKNKINEKGTEAEINHFSRRPGPKTILWLKIVR